MRGKTDRTARPAEAPEAPETLGGVLAEAVASSDLLRAHPYCYPLGDRVRDEDGRTYYLEAWDFRPPHCKGETFYVLRGGKTDARTVLRSDGTPFADAGRGKGRGLSPGFRDWIARAVETDCEALGREPTPSA